MSDLRFTDKRKRYDHWYRTLSRDERDVFEWLCDSCDVAGFVDIDKDVIAEETLINDTEKVGIALNQIVFSRLGVSKGYLRAKIGTEIYVMWLCSYIKFQELRKADVLNLNYNFHNKILRRLLQMKDLFPEVMEMYVIPSGYTGVETGTRWGSKKGNLIVSPKIDLTKGYKRREEKRVYLGGESERGKPALKSQSMTNNQLKGRHVLYDKVLACCDLRNTFPIEHFAELRIKWPEHDVNWPDIIDWVTKKHEIGAGVGNGVYDAHAMISAAITKGKFLRKGAPDPNETPETKLHKVQENKINKLYEAGTIDETECEKQHADNDEKFGVGK